VYWLATPSLRIEAGATLEDKAMTGVKNDCGVSH
jgi:hypothetical protein